MKELLIGLLVLTVATSLFAVVNAINRNTAAIEAASAAEVAAIGAACESAP